MQKSKGILNKKLFFSKRTRSAMAEILNYPLTIVEAPMGYGKSTAVREQLKINNANMMLLRVCDSSLSIFWNSFCHVFSSIDEKKFESLLQLEFPKDSVSINFAIEIIESIELPENSVMIIEDYHLVECKESNKFIEFLIMREMVDFNILLTTRYINYPRLEELELKGYLYHIEKEKFELRPGDIVSYFQQCEIKINGNQAQELYNLTEGWISALYLFMLNYKLKGNFYEASDIYTLLDKVIYSTLEEESKDLILNMCIFDSFTLDQARYIWHGENPEAKIGELVEKNAFITYDYSNKNYYIHSIFKKLLREKLEGKDSAFKAALYRKSAQWFMEKEDFLSAMHYSYLTKDFHTLLKIFEIDKGIGVHNDYNDLIIKYFEECPNKIKSKFLYGILIFARRMLIINRGDLFKKACEEFMANIQTMGIQEENNKNKLLGEYELLVALSNYNDIKKMSEYHKLSYSFLKSVSTITKVDSTWTMGSPSVLYMFYRKSGELEEDVKTIREAMPFYYKVASNHGKGAEDVMEGEHFYYKGDFDNSEIIMHKDFHEAAEASLSGINICVIFLKARLALTRGDFSLILNLVKGIRKDIDENRYHSLIPSIDMCEAYIYSILNIKENIQPWIKNGDFKNTRLFFSSMAFLNIVYGRVLLINGEYLKLIGSFQSFIGISSVFPNLLGQIYTYIYLAAANNERLRQKEAMEALKEALEIAMPDKLYMAFVENCDYIKPILEELKRQGIYEQEISRILELYTVYKKGIMQIKKKHSAKENPLLTLREIQIAQLGADGLTNKEIGERLFISQNTVKTTLKSIFEKLNINSRLLLKQNMDMEKYT